MEVTEQLAEVRVVSEKIKTLAQGMVELKSKNPKLEGVAGEEFAAARTRVHMLFLELKQLNRGILSTGQITKQQVQASKLGQDRLNLDLQGREYERTHFIKEINKCKDFKSAANEADLVSVEEFMRLEPTAQGLQGHGLQLARLSHELQARQSLLAKVEGLKKEQAELAAQHKTSKTFRDGLAGQVSKLYSEALAIQSGMPKGPMLVPPPASCAALPPPLYNLYNLAICFKSFMSSALVVAIIAEEPKDDGDVDMATGSSTTSENLEVTAAPSSVSITLKTDKTEVCLLFKFIPVFDVVTVTPTGKGLHASLLTNLYPHDAGGDIPSNIGRLAGPKLGLTIDRAHGVPYRWAQALCGLHYPHPHRQSYGQVDLASVLHRISHRIRVRGSLTKQYAHLQKKSLPGLGAKLEGLLPAKPKAVISQWTRIKPAQYHSACQENPNEWWKSGAEYFQAGISRANTALEVFVEVTAEYPFRPPRMHCRFSKKASTEKALVPNALVKTTADPAALALSMAQTGRAMGHHNDVQEIEFEVNSNFPFPLGALAIAEEAGSHLLCYQLQKIQVCFDVMSESADTSNAGKLYSQAIRGRDRRKPFVYDPKQHIFYSSTPGGPCL